MAAGKRISGAAAQDRRGGGKAGALGYLDAVGEDRGPDRQAEHVLLAARDLRVEIDACAGDDLEATAIDGRAGRGTEREDLRAARVDDRADREGNVAAADVADRFDAAAEDR